MATENHDSKLGSSISPQRRALMSKHFSEFAQRSSIMERTKSFRPFLRQMGSPLPQPSSISYSDPTESGTIYSTSSSSVKAESLVSESEGNFVGCNVPIREDSVLYVNRHDIQSPSGDSSVEFRGTLPTTVFYAPGRNTRNLEAY